MLLSESRPSVFRCIYAIFFVGVMAHYVCLLGPHIFAIVSLRTAFIHQAQSITPTTQLFIRNFTAKDNMVNCESFELCIGSRCTFQCQSKIMSPLEHLGSESGVKKLVDIEYSTGCTFQHPKSCNSCRCVNRTSRFKSQDSFSNCLPCRFKSIGWLSEAERAKCAPEICPAFFPLTCGISLISSKHLINLLTTTHTDGLWISLIGDSRMRGVFRRAVSFLSAQSTPITIAFNHSTYHQDHHICCSVSHNPIHGSKAQDCAVHIHPPSSFAPHPYTVAADLISRRRISVARRVAPICVSWQWSTAAAGLPALLDQYDAAHAETGARPAAVVLNPGLHSLLPGFNLDALVGALGLVLARCATLFRGGSGNYGVGPAAGGRACILQTTAHTTFSREAALEKGHRRHHAIISGYNAAASATWAAGGMPLIDAGALSLVPAISNSADADGIHFNGDGNPFHDLLWQFVLHTSLSGGKQVCEVSP